MLVVFAIVFLVHSPKIAQLFAISALSVRGVVFSSSDFSDSVMCISLIEIGNLAEFWLWPIYWEASQSGVSGVCTSLHFRPQPFRIDHYFVFCSFISILHLDIGLRCNDIFVPFVL